MSRLVASFDPSALAGNFQAGAINRCSTLWVMNESPNFISLDFGGAGTVKVLQPWYNTRLQLPNPVQTVNWSVLASLQSGSAPVSMVYVELFDPAEDVSSLISGPLFRQSNVGNAAAVTSATSSVQNDGAAAATTVIEATPSGAASSQLLWRNDGSGVFGGGLVTVSNAGIFTLPAGAIPVASLSGSVPSTSTLDNALTASDDGTNAYLKPVTTTHPVGVYGGTALAVLFDTQGQANFQHSIIPNAGGSLGGIKHISGSGSATVNHGLSATPAAALVNTNNGQNSTTYGSGSYTSSSVYIYQFNAQAWTGIVYL